jgi:hypothetical protein
VGAGQVIESWISIADVSLAGATPGRRFGSRSRSTEPSRRFARLALKFAFGATGNTTIADAQAIGSSSTIR